ncbi:MAG: protease modulator HflK [Planctomycetota bacterium]|jgi:membrane protease subunit HflK
MTEHDIEEHEHFREPQADQAAGEELDAAGKYLSEALRISFITLKIIMIVLVLVFFASGFRTVGSDERALVLRFGRIRGAGDKRLLGPGPHWVFPYPIEEIVKIPVGKKVNMPIDSFWYFQHPSAALPKGPKDRSRPPKNLDPVRDGYCITQGERQSQGVLGAGGNDYSIVHTKWQVIYQIDNAELFFRNISVGDVRPGQVYFDVMTESVRPLLESVVADAVVTAMVDYTIDEATSSRDRIPRHVRSLVQKKLDELKTGIEIVSMQLTKSEWPRQVDPAFQLFMLASQNTAISEARTYAETTLSQAAGPVAEELFAVLEGKDTSEQQEQVLWDNVAGTAREKIAHARAYRTQVVETAKANADYLQKILPEFRKRPELVVQRIYLDAIEEVLSNADEIFVIQPAEGAKDGEIRVMVNRNPAISSEQEQQER